jgi:mxaD protein
MARVSESAKLYVPAERVWQTIGDFEQIQTWHPAVLGCETDRHGTLPQRRMDLAEAVPQVEQLDQQDDDNRRHLYSFVSGPLPVAEMQAELRVNADDASSCTIEWTAQLSPRDEVEDAEADAIATVRDFFRRGLEHLRFTLAG